MSDRLAAPKNPPSHNSAARPNRVIAELVEEAPPKALLSKSPQPPPVTLASVTLPPASSDSTLPPPVEHRTTVTKSEEIPQESGKHGREPKTAMARVGEFFSQPSWLVSLIFHLGLVIVLLCVALTQEKQTTLTLVHSDSSDSMQEIFEFETTDSDMLESLDVTEIAAEEAVTVLDSTSLKVETPASLVSVELGNDGVADIGKIAEGMSSAAPRSAANFFGTKAIARSVVFVVDNSNSMGGGKLETALIEMNKAIAQLTPKQKFYIIFYSDTAYPLFYPQSARTLIPASPANKRRTAYWLESIQMCLQTRGSKAIEMARYLSPDLIYLLGDGAFTDKAAQELIGNPIQNATIHTLGMQVKRKDAANFQAIADKHRGTYIDVGVTLEGKAMFKRTGGRPKNNKKGPVWGINLKK